MIRIFIIILISLFFFSCNETEKKLINDKIPKDSIPKKTNPFVANRNIFNANIFLKYGDSISYSDIRDVMGQLKKHALIDTTIKIRNNLFPSFTYLSPSAMLKGLQIQSKSYHPENFKVLTPKDVEFMLEQNNFRYSRGFKWQLITNHIDSMGQFPHYEVSIPVFSIDKKKFIVCIEHHTAKDCMPVGISYFFIKKKNSYQYSVFDKVEGCTD